MLQSNISTEDCNQNSTPSRLKELIARYEEPVRAIVHRTLEEFVERCFTEFIEGKIGTEIPRASDRKPVTEYRNGHREVKQAVIDTLVLHGFRINI